jgi:hypothetical protein
MLSFALRRGALGAARVRCAAPAPAPARAALAACLRRGASGDAAPPSAAASGGGASSASGGSSGASSSASASREAPAAPVGGVFWRLREAAKDVLAVTLGMERVRDVGAEYDAGLRAYPWTEYVDGAGARSYRNADTGVSTPAKPADFDARAPASARGVAVDGGARAVAAAAAPAPGAWARTLAAVSDTPLIAALRGAGAAVAASPVGAAAARARAAVADRVEDAREVWETSQHPLVVSASSAVDALTAETESGRAIRELTAQDAAFDAHAFVDEMTRVVIPTVVPAFFRADMAALRVWCKDAALAQVRAVAAARQIEGLAMDGLVLNVQRVEIGEAKTLERGTPIILVTSQVQYIHCIRNKKVRA